MDSKLVLNAWLACADTWNVLTPIPSGLEGHIRSISELGGGRSECKGAGMYVRYAQVCLLRANMAK